jgi:hypothetical protein
MKINELSQFRDELLKGKEIDVEHEGGARGKWRPKACCSADLQSLP